jgi:hypothetical protein
MLAVVMKRCVAAMAVMLLACDSSSPGATNSCPSDSCSTLGVDALCSQASYPCNSGCLFGACGMFGCEVGGGWVPAGINFFGADGPGSSVCLRDCSQVPCPKGLACTDVNPGAGWVRVCVAPSSAVEDQACGQCPVALCGGASPCHPSSCGYGDGCEPVCAFGTCPDKRTCIIGPSDAGNGGSICSPECPPMMGSCVLECTSPSDCPAGRQCKEWQGADGGLVMACGN